MNEQLIKSFAHSQSEDKDVVQKIARKNRDVLNISGMPVVELKTIYSESFGGDFERLFNVMHHSAVKDDIYFI